MPALIKDTELDIIEWTSGVTYGRGVEPVLD